MKGVQNWHKETTNTVFVKKLGSDTATPLSIPVPCTDSFPVDSPQMVAFSNWPSSVQKTMQFLQGLDTFQLIVSSRNSGYLKDLHDRLSVFQDRLERFPHRSNLTLKCALHLFWRKKTWFAFHNMPKQIFRYTLDANLCGIPFSMILKKVEMQQPLAVIQTVQGTFHLPQAPSIKPSRSVASMAWSSGGIGSESSINFHLVLSQNGILDV